MLSPLSSPRCGRVDKVWFNLAADFPLFTAAAICSGITRPINTVMPSPVASIPTSTCCSLLLSSISGEPVCGSVRAKTRTAVFITTLNPSVIPSPTSSQKSAWVCGFFVQCSELPASASAHTRPISPLIPPSSVAATAVMLSGISDRNAFQPPFFTMMGPIVKRAPNKSERRLKTGSATLCHISVMIHRSLLPNE